MSYKALTYLAFGDNRKAPGDKISAKELKDAGQDEAQIKQLMDSGAISDNMDAEIDSAHIDVPVEAAGDTDRHIGAGDEGGSTDENS